MGRSEGQPALLEEQVYSARLMDERLTRDMMRLSEERFGMKLFVDAAQLFFGERDPSREEEEAELQLLLPWFLYHFRREGRPLVEWFLEGTQWQLTSAERAWIEAQRRAWISIWEVIGVEPGKGLILKDLLTREERSVHESTGSVRLGLGDALLGRVVDGAGISLLCGLHPRPLPPSFAQEISAIARVLFEVESGPVSVELLLAVPLYDVSLLRSWQVMVDEVLGRPGPASAEETEQVALAVTSDVFAFAPGDRARVIAGLAAIEGTRVEGESEDVEVLFIRRHDPANARWASTVLGIALVSSDSLRLGATTPEKAELLRGLVEQALGTLLQHHSRERVDPATLRGAPAFATASSPEELLRRVLEVKHRSYTAWVDVAMSGLGGLTPRQAVKVPAARAEVEQMLEEIETGEARLPLRLRFDVSILRRLLGLER